MLMLLLGLVDPMVLAVHGVADPGWCVVDALLAFCGSGMMLALGDGVAGLLFQQEALHLTTTTFAVKQQIQSWIQQKQQHPRNRASHPGHINQILLTNQPEPGSNGASASSGSIQHSSQNSNTSRSAPPISLQLTARAAFQANIIVDPSESTIQKRERRKVAATIHTCPDIPHGGQYEDTDRPRCHIAQIGMVNNHTKKDKVPIGQKHQAQRKSNKP
ncbi:hypothetical protein Nepgr_033799 [Nepenthes gracilis]|uniref:Uncharacterized protein n=1 Tax=Nepenthes gracilis TaxID=150966 RepID=A0AAD3TL29_NEPGR|nr:hypothetical protein Nepgr_033799 [Nepenthes gracilis]